MVSQRTQIPPRLKDISNLGRIRVSTRAFRLVRRKWEFVIMLFYELIASGRKKLFLYLDDFSHFVRSLRGIKSIQKRWVVVMFF